MFSKQVLDKLIASCDERIASLQEKLDSWKGYKGVMEMCENLYSNEDDKNVFRYSPKMDNVRNDENSMKLVKTEKLIYTSLRNTNSKKEIFKILLAKYDELMGISYDISGNMVRNGIVVESKHIDYCKSSLDQREYIRKICCIGYGENTL
tara:strand:- start:100 stop:549 length:450 start_codon:yes stop_codon:yes gene_type:complete